MPLIVDDDGPVLDSPRLSFRERLRSGRVVPIVSDEAVFNRMMGGYQPFLASYARYVKFNRGEPYSLVGLAKYHKYRPREKPLNDQALKFDYLNYVKNHFYRLAKPIRVVVCASTGGWVPASAGMTGRGWMTASPEKQSSGRSRARSGWRSPPRHSRSPLTRLPCHGLPRRRCADTAPGFRKT